MTHGKLHIGTSGWNYDHWKGPFYPENMAANKMLEHYTMHFKSVELNNSFYHLPKRETLTRWRELSPVGFSFSAKASRYITHMKKLKDPEASIKRFFERITALEEKLGPILFQLPPHWQFNQQRLLQFLNSLSQDFRYSFEFRDPSWINDDTFELLTRFDAAFCIYDLDGYLAPKEITTDLVYIRLHGPNGPYQGNYHQHALSGWAGAICAWIRQGLSVYCYFDNDESGHAPKNALALQSMLKPEA